MGWPLSQVRGMIDQGFLPLLAGDLGGIENYWNKILLDFPQHPAHGQEASSIPLTLYGSFLARILFHSVGFQYQKFDPKNS